MILCFDKPQKAQSTTDHNAYYASESVPGTYVPNMSEDDKQKWKAKHIKGKEERVEIRKTFSNYGSYSQVLIKVYKDGVKISMNGATGLTSEEYNELQLAVQEAQDILSDK